MFITTHPSLCLIDPRVFCANGNIFKGKRGLEVGLPTTLSADKAESPVRRHAEPSSLLECISGASLRVHGLVEVPSERPFLPRCDRHTSLL